MPFDLINNYYEQLVFDCISETTQVPEDVDSDDFLQDVACVALNKLPARYIRHNVDMSFYTQKDEREKMFVAVDNAVKEAFDYVITHHPKKILPTK